MISATEWSDLLELIEDGCVIPVIGEQLLQVEHAGKAIPLYGYIAQRLTEQLRLPAETLPERFSLNEVICRHLARRGDPNAIYPKIRPILRQALFEPPVVLEQLARIERFNLFISLTFDSLLVDALNRVRFGGEPRTLELAYNPAGKDAREGQDDLPQDWRKSRQPVVFHLLGKLSASPDYAVSDEDLLEFCYSLQSPERRPERLFEALGENHLLFIGCRFSDWLARFFIRLSKGQPLSIKRSSWEMLVDHELANDSSLVVFLSHFSANTRILPMRPADFVTELANRWQARRLGHPEPAAAVGGLTAVPAEMEPGSIFISYASEDLAAAQALHQGLEQANLDVWLDKQRLAAGDHWDAKIRRHIQQCSLFMPLISRHTEHRLEGYFRREWRWAAERSHGIAEGVPFILPVVVDDTPDSRKLRVPEEFFRSQWTRLTGGRLTPEFAGRLRQVIREYWKRQRS